MSHPFHAHPLMHACMQHIRKFFHVAIHNGNGLFLFSKAYHVQGVVLQVHELLVPLHVRSIIETWNMVFYTIKKNLVFLWIMTTLHRRQITWCSFNVVPNIGANIIQQTKDIEGHCRIMKNNKSDQIKNISYYHIISLAKSASNLHFESFSSILWRYWMQAIRSSRSSLGIHIDSTSIVRKYKPLYSTWVSGCRASTEALFGNLNLAPSHARSSNSKWVY